MIKSIRNYRESNTNCNKVNMLAPFSYHTCKSAQPSHTIKVLCIHFGFILNLIICTLYKTDYHMYGQLFHIIIIFFTLCVLEKC